MKAKVVGIYNNSASRINAPRNNYTNMMHLFLCKAAFVQQTSDRSSENDCHFFTV